jgi:alpha-ribazole phosphatase/probable phosphoglycerate mutase
MSCIFLVRHGEVEGNSGPNRTFAGWGDKPLTEKGIAQARAVAERLASAPLKAVYSSDLQRARVTAEHIAAKHGLEVVADRSLREVNYGLWEGLGDRELLERWGDHWQRRVADPLNVAPPEGESYADLWKRLEPAWLNILQNHSEDSVALVGHNGSLRVLLCHLLGAPLSNARQIRLMNTSISCVEVERDPMETQMKTQTMRLVITSINDTCHLAGI